MQKKILVVNSLNDWNSKYNLGIYEELAGDNLQFFLFSNNKIYKEFFTKISWKKIRYWGLSNPKNLLSTIIYVILLPLAWLVFFPNLLYFKKRLGVSTVILYGIPEKLIFTPLCKILSIGCIWLSLPRVNRERESKILNKIIRFFSTWACIVVYNEKAKKILSAIGVKEEKIEILTPGINHNQAKHQEDIFDRMAEKETLLQKRKFFTIGTENNLEETEKIKTLFQAVEKCIDVIPNLQIIIIGEGPQRKNLSWLARKMGIENLVWFIGEQNNFNKWLNNLDVFIYSKQNFDLEDINRIIKASSAGIPVICQNDIGLDDFVLDNVNGVLIDPGSEKLAEIIIKLEQDDNLRKRLSRSARELAFEKFNFQMNLQKFKELINSNV